jgi:Ca2+-transporting ATPase
MATAHETSSLDLLPRPAAHAVFVKGALHAVMEAASAIETSGGPVPLDGEVRGRIESEHDRLAAQGMRLLAIAWRPLEAGVDAAALKDLERDLIFLALAGMRDPPRPEAAEAVAKCQSAGIRTIMITGDHPKTAHAIAAEVGIPAGGGAMSGLEIQAADDEELARRTAETNVYARVSPEDKLRIIDALERNGHIVAMTGDGVNDAPALKRADIGVAMGINGSDVAKEAADMVLRDDNFATIVAAIEEGRVIFDNVRKFIRYLLAANCGELWVMLAGPLAGMPTPLAPLQILWMNLITDGPPALALGVEPAEKDVMRRPPSPPGETVFSGGVGRDVVWIGLLTGSLALAIGWSYWRRGLPQWQTMVFTTLTFSQMALALAVRSSRESLFALGLWSNLSLTLAVVLSTGLQLAVLYWAPLRGVFGTTALSGRDLLWSAGAAAIVFAAVEAEKALGRRVDGKRRGQAAPQVH